MTLPQVAALSKFWRHTPPAAFQLKRISIALGIEPEPVRKVIRNADDALKEALAAGLPVMHGLPDDPILKFLDD
ncbi:MAG: hypothetical protein REI09_05220 [Candidatus Dactylopiibacterium sp.]|nr:hypothetical protein [Candidatus Dactylopiibacterium sp.]